MAEPYVSCEAGERIPFVSAELYERRAGDGDGDGEGDGDGGDGDGDGDGDGAC